MNERVTTQAMHYANYKTILSPKNGMNIYRGCSHGCIYCDSRSVCYQMNHDFEDIEIKRNAPQILKAQLQRKRKSCMIVTGSMCDPYIPLENKLRFTRQCLEIIEQYAFGLSILTKSTRILRDLDLLASISRKKKCVVATTLTTFDEDLCRILEPNVSTTLERYTMLETMREAGIPTVVWLCPILPFINDTEENLRGLLDYCVEAQVRGILCFGFGMTLREGNREYFYEQLDKHFPGLKQKYISTFGNSYACNSPSNAQLMHIFNDTCKQHGIMHKTDEVFVYLSQFDKTEGQAEQLILC